ncbi:MAG TPA: hypothetical protein VFD92_17290 [Candidatus Binatia bacterium]|nr:hypothetical protein [Candidatus Binatia bacterium]
MTFVVVSILLALLAAALGFPLRQFWRAADASQRERDEARARDAALAGAWEGHADIAQVVLTVIDFREAGWSDGRTRTFLAERFAGRAEVRVEELRAFLDDSMVRDVLAYRRLRRDAADRYEAIRQTWINVDDLEKQGLLPPEVRPLVTERERQSGRLVLAGDLLPFVGRPVIRDLLERKLADVGIAPAAGARAKTGSS